MTTSARRVTQKPTFTEAPTPGGLWSRNFGYFFVARAVAKLGDMMLPIALAAGLIQYGHGAGAVGAAMASFSACVAGFVIFGGVIADRVNVRLLMIGSDVVRIGTQSLAAALFFSGHVVLWQICAIGAANGIAAALFQPGVASTVPRIAHDVQGANGAIRTAESVMALAGPAVAGILVGLTSVGGVFLAHAGTYVISALCLLLMRLPPLPRASGNPAPGKRRRGAFRSELAEGWREFRARTWLWGVIVIWMGFQLTAWAPVIPLVAAEIIGEFGAGAYGLVNSALGGGMAVGGLIAMRLRPRRPLRAGSIALIGAALQPLPVALGMPVPVIAGSLAIAGGCMTFWGVMWATSVQTQVPGPILNRIHAWEVAGSLAMLPVGQALAGPAAELFGIRNVLLANTVMTLVGVVALLCVPAIRNLVRVGSTGRKPG